MELDGARASCSPAPPAASARRSRGRSHERGAELVLSGRRAEALEALAPELGAETVPCDLADRDARRAAWPTRPATSTCWWPTPGCPAPARCRSSSQDEIDRVLEVNLRAPIALARRLAPAMVERGRGQLVFVASFAGKVPSAGESSIYTATKFGLRGFAHVLRAQMKRKGVGVSLVTPGPVRDAGMFARGGGKPPPLIGTSSPEDVGKAVVRAIERNAAEIDVASLGLRAMSKLGALAPATIADRTSDR